MASYEIPRQYNDQEIKVPVRTRKKERICVKVYHPLKPNTVYFDAAPIITGEDMFVIKIPRMPEAVIMDIYNPRNGNNTKDGTFQVGKIRWRPITQGFVIKEIMDPNVKRFSRFIDDFAENAAVISAGNSVYHSPDGRFKIDYKDVIRDENGAELRTPLRVNSETKVMEIAKKHYVKYTVPARKFWAWHEYAHVWKNKNPSDELEADKHAIMIYLGTGNPVVEAYNGIFQVFKNTPSNLNRQRYEALNAYIKDFTNNMQK